MPRIQPADGAFIQAEDAIEIDTALTIDEVVELMIALSRQWRDKMALYRLVRLLLRLIFRVVFRWKVIGADNIPESGPVLVAANHISLLDPPVVGCAVRREISYMAKAELFERPIFRWFLAKLKAFPVRRGKADRTAIRTALEILKQGGVVGLFPEGTRSRTGEMLSPQHGVALLAIKSNAVIVPTAVYGTNRVDKLFGFHPIPKSTSVW